jgi:hypothetical protein
MAYMPSADSIFFSQPDISNLKRLDLKTGLISTVLNNNTQLSHPAALWCQDNKLYIADKDLPQVDELDWKDNTPANPVSVATTLANILSLSWNGDILYALLENPGVPAERLFLDKRFDNGLVSFRSPGGDTIPQEPLPRVSRRTLLMAESFMLPNLIYKALFITATYLAALIRV